MRACKRMDKSSAKERAIEQNEGKKYGIESI